MLSCRICKKDNLTKFLDLGKMPPADSFLNRRDLKREEKKYPLEVYICNECRLVQLGYTVPPEILYRKNYPYESSITRTGVSHFHLFASTVHKDFALTKEDLVVDIGSNVGVLLDGFKAAGSPVLGVEPAGNICKISKARGIDAVNDFFNRKVVQEILKKKGKAKIVTGTNVVAHIDDLHSLVKNIKNLLSEKGVFIFEAPYSVDLISNLEYDTIYHEHLSYLSVKPLAILFDKFGMEIFDVKKQKIHGGSLRYFAARKNDYPISRNVSAFLALERKKKIYNISTLRQFARKVSGNRERLTTLLLSLKKQGKSIAGVGAPAKGMTLLNYCQIGSGILDFITEKSKLKIGTFTPGQHIPVVDDSWLTKKKPDYALLLAWNFSREIMSNLKDYRKSGGKFIIPIPKPVILS